jgi:hypothetical protein
MFQQILRLIAALSESSEMKKNGGAGREPLQAPDS